jgi:uncharacterized protein
MKYLVLVLIVVLVLWLGRSSRRTPAARAPTPPTGRRQAMIACAQCGLHLPRDEALPGRGGLFCGEAHRTEYEKAHPPS